MRMGGGKMTRIGGVVVGSAKDARDLSLREREARVLELRKAGLTFKLIAERVGYKTESAAYRAFQRGMQATIQQPADELRALELERLDAMLAALWPFVLKGRGYAVEKALMIQDRRARYLGLDAPRRTESTVSVELVAQIEQLAAELGVVDAEVVDEPKAIEQNAHRTPPDVVQE